MQSIDTTSAAFVAGMVTSIHCTAMCGPLACSWAVVDRKGRFGFVRDTALYHGGRLLSYGSVGALAGAVGQVPLRYFQSGAGVLLPWLIVLAFALVGVGADRYLPKPALFARPLRQMQGLIFRLDSSLRAGLLGLATPLLPCGPLYVMFGLAMVNGSALKGGAFSMAFALGTLPLLALAQTQLHWLGGRLSPVMLRRFQRALALVAACMLAWRLRDTLGVLPDGTASSCCSAPL